VAVLGICSLKGGVGKTSVTLGLASAAIHAGLRTLVVDLDPQADTTLALGVSGTADNDVAAVLDNPSLFVIESAITASPWNPELLHVVMGSNESARHDGPSYSHRLTRLKHALEAVKDRYDLILIDCPPSLGGLTRQGLTSCDRALVVTELGLFSVTAAARAFQAIDQIQQDSAPQLKPLGILVNRVRTRSSEQAYRQEELTEMFGPLILSTYIPERSALQQAQGAGSPIHAWPSRAARDLSDRFDAVLSRAVKSIALDKEVVAEETHGEVLKRAFDDSQNSPDADLQPSGGEINSVPAEQYESSVE
jgi:chromosome partitioning protein